MLIYSYCSFLKVSHTESFLKIIKKGCYLLKANFWFYCKILTCTWTYGAWRFSMVQCSLKNEICIFACVECVIFCWLRNKWSRLDYQPLFGKGARAPPRTHGWTHGLSIVNFDQWNICLPESSRLHKLSLSQKQRSCVIWRAIALAGNLTKYLQLME